MKKCWKHCILVSVFGMVYVIVYLSLLITYHCICICAVVLQMSFYVLWKKFYTDFVFFTILGFFYHFSRMSRRDIVILIELYLSVCQCTGSMMVLLCRTASCRL